MNFPRPEAHTQKPEPGLFSSLAITIEGRLAEQNTTIAKRKRRELSTEERSAIRQRLVAGQQAKREREAAAIAVEAKKANKQKGAKNGSIEATN